MHQDNQNSMFSPISQYLEYTEHILKSTSLSLPAISSGVFGVLKIDVAQAMYQALVKFDETRRNHVKEVRIVNVDLETTTILEKEFKWWFGQTPLISERYQEILMTDGTESLLLFIRSYQEDVTTNRDRNVTEPTNGDDILMVRRKNKECIPEKFTYSHSETLNPISRQNGKINI